MSSQYYYTYEIVEYINDLKKAILDYSHNESSV